MRIHSSSLSLQTNTTNRPAAKNKAVQDIDLVGKSHSQNEKPTQHPSSPNEIQKLLSTVALQLNAATSEGFDTRTSKALLAYRLESNSSITTQSMSEITGIDVYV